MSLWILNRKGQLSLIDFLRKYLQGMIRKVWSLESWRVYIGKYEYSNNYIICFDANPQMIVLHM